MNESIEELSSCVELIVYLVFYMTGSPRKIATSCFLQFIGDPSNSFLPILQRDIGVNALVPEVTDISL